ncbi:MAG: hypothetical protein JNK93_14000 [Planctomycetia bacterium]|nr:hypothetical protein [Planctomycetia bacterium]
MPARSTRPARPTPRTPAQRQQAEKALAALAVATLRANYAKQGRTPTASEERQAVIDARRQRDAKAARQQLQATDEANGVPHHRRLR